MTREKWAAMSDDERRIKIAELCGLESIHFDKNRTRLLHVVRRQLFGGYATRVPDYLNDLNAMREVLDTLEGGVRHLAYMNNIMKVIIPDGDEWWAGSNNDLESLHNATAAQRAEAFALTMEPE